MDGREGLVGGEREREGKGEWGKEGKRGSWEGIASWLIDATVHGSWKYTTV